MKIAVVEKKNKHAVHAYCSSKESAQRYIDGTIPEYCKRGLFTDKTLKPGSFRIRILK